MNNFLYAVLLVWVKALQLADADCEIPDVANANAIEDSQLMETTMECQIGYSMRSIMNCDEGPWIFEDPVCLPDECFDEPEISNGALDDALTSRNIGDVFDFTCNPPFVSNGNKGTVTCTESGEWETDIICEAGCLDDPEITNGDLDLEITSRKPGDTYGYTCNQYSIKNGNTGTVTCTGTGEWQTDKTCEDCFIRTAVLAFCDVQDVDTEDLCKALCTGDCRVYRFLPTGLGDCQLCSLPTLEEINQLSFADCIQKCKDSPECLTLHHFGDVCSLYSATLQALSDRPDFDVGIFGSGPTDVVAEKNSCPSIL